MLTGGPRDVGALQLQKWNTNKVRKHLHQSDNMCTTNTCNQTDQHAASSTDDNCYWCMRPQTLLKIGFIQSTSQYSCSKRPSCKLILESPKPTFKNLATLYVGGGKVCTNLWFLKNQEMLRVKTVKVRPPSRIISQATAASRAARVMEESEAASAAMVPPITVVRPFQINHN